eukprot:ctg_336.g180
MSLSPVPALVDGRAPRRTTDKTRRTSPNRSVAVHRAPRPPPPATTAAAPGRHCQHAGAGAPRLPPNAAVSAALARNRHAARHRTGAAAAFVHPPPPAPSDTGGG